MMYMPRSGYRPVPGRSICPAIKASAIRQSTGIGAAQSQLPPPPTPMHVARNRKIHPDLYLDRACAEIAGATRGTPTMLHQKLIYFYKGIC